MPETTFTDPDPTTFLGLDALGLTAMGQLLTSTRAIVECRMPIGFEDPFCKACGASPAPAAAGCGGRTPPAWLSPGLTRDTWSAWCFSDRGSFSSRESIG